MTWRDFYMSDWQGLYLLWVVPAVFLVYFLLIDERQARDADDRFVHRYVLFFGVETLLDAFVPGAFVRWLGLAEAPIATAILVFFVLLGDFRVFLLLFRMAAVDSPFARALGWTVVTPIVAYATTYALGQLVAGGLPGQSIWLAYELTFAAVISFVRANALRASPFVSGVYAYVVTYYLLWAAADVLILAFGLDLGWALRVVPNQLYYSFYVPFVYALYARERRND